jgi:putative membrane protein
MLGYFMIGVEVIAEEIEEPFGVNEDDLLLDEICQTIERSVGGIFADPLLAPENFSVPLPKAGTSIAAEADQPA